MGSMDLMCDTSPKRHLQLIEFVGYTSNELCVVKLVISGINLNRVLSLSQPYINVISSVY